MSSTAGGVLGGGVAPVSVCVGVGLEPSEFCLCVQGPKVGWLSMLCCWSYKDKVC